MDFNSKILLPNWVIWNFCNFSQSQVHILFLMKGLNSLAKENRLFCYHYSCVKGPYWRNGIHCCFENLFRILWWFCGAFPNCSGKSSNVSCRIIQSRNSQRYWIKQFDWKDARNAQSLVDSFSRVIFSHIQSKYPFPSGNLNSVSMHSKTRDGSLNGMDLPSTWYIIESLPNYRKQSLALFEVNSSYRKTFYNAPLCSTYNGITPVKISRIASLDAFIQSAALGGFPFGAEFGTAPLIKFSILLTKFIFTIYM